METVPATQEEINLPDVFDKDDMSIFVLHLDTQLQRRGVKQLRIYAQSVYRNLLRIESAVKHMERILHVVNSEPTKAQQQFYTERKVRTAAQRFYSTLSNHALEVHLDAFGMGDKPYTTREAIVNALVKEHVQRELDAVWGEAAQDAERSGYIGVEETERVLTGE